MRTFARSARPRLALPATLLFAATALCAVGCGDDESAPPASGADAAKLTPAERMCQSLADAINGCGAATPCDQALVADCADMVGLLSDSYLESAATCIEGGGVAQTCMVDALAALEPTAAHASFGHTFCETCGFGMPGCEETLFGGESEFAVLGKLLFPFSDALVSEVASTCVSSALDCPSLPQCVQGVIVAHALPENTVQCVVDNLSGAASETEVSTCAASDGTGSETGTDTGVETGTGTGSETGTGTGTGTAGMSWANVEIDGTTVTATGWQVWETDYGISVFIDIVGPGIPSGSDVVVDLLQPGGGCAPGNEVWFRPDLSSTSFDDQYRTEGSASCGLDVASVPAAPGDHARGTFIGTLNALQDFTTPEEITAVVDFDIEM
jgi:hypothetical protein